MMILFGARLSLASVGLLASVAVAVSACASDNSRERRGPPNAQAGQRGGFEGAAIQPIGLFYATMDADGDYIVGPAELRSGLQQEWLTLASGEAPGAIRYAEWSRSAFGVRYTVPGFLALDRDGNGVLTENEFTQQFLSHFEELDRNHDGALQREELVRQVASARRQRGGQEGGERRRREDGGEGQRRRR